MGGLDRRHQKAWSQLYAIAPVCKSTVQAGARDSYFAGRDFPSLEAWRADALRWWCTDVAGMRSCRVIDGAAPAVLFAAVEAKLLVALPARPFELAT